MIKTVTTTRLCRRCKIDKPLQDYYTDSRVNKDGRRSICKICSKRINLPPKKIYINPLTKYVVNQNGCWIWQGAHCGSYGNIQWNGKSVGTHRVFYEITKGEIPEGLVIDHLCSVKNCVNPDHLEAVTPSVNTQRAWNRNHCLSCTCKED